MPQSCYWAERSTEVLSSSAGWCNNGKGYLAPRLSWCVNIVVFGSCEQYVNDDGRWEVLDSLHVWRRTDQSMGNWFGRWRKVAGSRDHVRIHSMVLDEPDASSSSALGLVSPSPDCLSSDSPLSPGLPNWPLIISLARCKSSLPRTLGLCGNCCELFAMQHSTELVTSPSFLKC